MDDTKIKFTEDMLEALRKRVQDYRSTSSETWKGLAAKMAIGESTLQAFCKGNYPGNNQEVADQVAKWFRTEETAELFANHFLVPGFQPTSTAKYIHATLHYAKQGNIATIMGSPGLGKTMALRKYKDENSNVYLVTGSPGRRHFNKFMVALLDGLNVSVSGRTGADHSDKVLRILKQRQSPLLIVDEAQHLGENVLEELRFFHDETGCGLVWCGNHEVSGKVDGNRTANFAQRASRVGKRVDLTGPMGFDVKIMLEAWGIVDDREAEFLRRIAEVPGGGALRQMSKVLEQATLMARAENKKRTFNHLVEANDDLTAGIAA